MLSVLAVELSVWIPYSRERTAINKIEERFSIGSEELSTYSVGVPFDAWWYAGQ